MDFLRKEDIVKPPQFEIKTLDIPELGGAIRIREMTGTERDQLEEYYANHEKGKSWRRYRALVVVLSIVDENNQRIFSDEDIDQVNATVPWRVLDRIQDAVFELNNLKAAAAEKAVGDAEKNSSPGPSDGSTSV